MENSGSTTHGRMYVGDWLVDPTLCRISREGQSVRVRAKVMDLLMFLAARPGDVISKDALLNGVWGTEAVSESALTRTITELRQAFGDTAQKPSIVETISKRGYRLIAPVRLDRTPDVDPRDSVDEKTRPIAGAPRWPGPML